MFHVDLGWRITNEKTEYKHPLPPLSKEEIELLMEIEKVVRNNLLSKEEKAFNLDKEKIIKKIQSTIIALSEMEGLLVDDDQLNYLSSYLYHHMFGLAFLDHLLEDESIEEISVPAIGVNAYVYVRKQGWKKTNALFTSESMMMDVINKVASSIGRRITLQHPRINAVLPDGSRLHASLAPISKGEITIRKFRREQFSPTELVDSKTIDIRTLAVMSIAMQSDLSIIIAGNTASGKTTTLNALFSFVPLQERVILVEETPEIQIPHEHQIRLVPNESMNIKLLDLIYDTLRMRPDRMVVGEVRAKEEIEAMFECVLSGQAKGTYATMHGKTSVETLSRLKRMGIDEKDIEAIDIIVVQRRRSIYDLEKRKMLEIRKVEESVCVKDGKPIVKSKVLRERIASALNISEKELKEEIARREKFLKGASRSFEECLRQCQAKWYGIG
jgi:Flp pilus assembly CpaF family ATPase